MALVAALSALALFVVSTLVWTQLDLDGDGLKTSQEWKHDTDVFRDDSDRDGLADGWETARGFDPLEADTDRDGIDDGRETELGSNVTDPDTDGDGFGDLEESLLPRTDCNADGIPALRQVDDDSDGRPDHLEPEAHRCEPDFDGDGVLDGEERNEACVELVDCDGDGLEDGVEFGTRFDPLNPDSFNASLYDSVMWTFNEQGQQASGDQDGDGIPDAWEASTGLIDWGPFEPSADHPDLLIEFVRVYGPDSGRYDWLDFTPSYESVELYMEGDSDLEVHWVETRVGLPTEQRPHIIPSRYSNYYEDILDQAEHSGNPYVTTVVMNPQHDQSEVLHLGAAPIRGMLAAVDYGAHTMVDFNFNGDVIGFSPFLESIIAGDQQALIQAHGFDYGGIDSSGEYYLRGDGYWLLWDSDWFQTAPRLELDTGEILHSSNAGADVDSVDLTHTILHELGHTLGLCHTELDDCAANLTAEDQFNAGSSTMHSGSDPTTLNFLDSEWEQVLTYVACPPQEPIQMLAMDHTAAEILDAKYGYALDDILDVGSRECGDFETIPDNFTFLPDLFAFEPAASDVDPPEVTRSTLGSVLYAVAAVVLAAGAAAFAGWRRWKTLDGRE